MTVKSSTSPDMQAETPVKPAKKRPTRPLPEFLSENDLIVARYETKLKTALYDALRSDADRLTIEVNLIRVRTDATRKELKVQFPAAVPRYIAYRVVEVDSMNYYIVQDVETREQALAVIVEKRATLEREWKLQVYGVLPSGLTDSIELLEWAVGRS